MDTPRRSARLEASGYYDMVGNPTISYKESLKRSIFRRRRKRKLPINEDLDGNEGNNFSDGSSYNISSIMKIVCLVILMLSTCFGLTYLIPALSRTSSLDSSCVKSPASSYPCHLLKSTYKDVLKQMRELQEELARMKSGYISEVDTWPNYALKSLGARIVWQKSAETYCAKRERRFSPLMLSWVCPKLTDVIQGRTQPLPGRCWAFGGERGHLVVALSHPVAISHVSLGHILKSVSPTGSISSAPKEFSIYGMKTPDDMGHKLGTFFYDLDGKSLQTFQITDHKSGIYRFVKLQVDSNWGNPTYTCLYSLRVHGQLSKCRSSSIVA